MILYCRVIGPHFISKLVFTEGKCTETDSILSKFLHRSFFDFITEVQERNWNYMISSKESGHYTYPNIKEGL